MTPVLETNTKVVLDLSQLRVIDSSGLGCFLSCLRKLSSRGGSLKLGGMSPQIRAITELLRLHRILEIYSTKEEAVRAFER